MQVIKHFLLHLLIRFFVTDFMCVVCVCMCEYSMRSSCLSICEYNWFDYLVKLDSEYKLVPGRKRIHAPADSSSDEGQNSPTNQPNLSVKEKEARLIALRHSEPDYDTMVSTLYNQTSSDVNTDSITRSVRMLYTIITGTSKLPPNICTRNV